MDFPAAPVDNTFRGGGHWQSNFDTNRATQTTTTDDAEQLRQNGRRKQLSSDLPTQIPASIDPTPKNPYRCKQCGRAAKFPIQHRRWPRTPVATEINSTWPPSPHPLYVERRQATNPPDAAQSPRARRNRKNARDQQSRTNISTKNVRPCPRKSTRSTRQRSEDPRGRRNRNPCRTPHKIPTSIRYPLPLRDHT